MLPLTPVVPIQAEQSVRRRGPDRHLQWRSLYKLVTETSLVFTEVLDDAVVRDGLADHDASILGQAAYLVVTTVRTRYPPRVSLAA